MKKTILILILVMTVTVFGGCSFDEDFESQRIYQTVSAVESCTDPEDLRLMLEGIYGETFSYILLEYDAEADSFKQPYQEFVITISDIYRQDMDKEIIKEDVYAFFMPMHESPTFIMTEKGSYIVDEYSIDTNADGSYTHKVGVWVATDLYKCLNGYAGEDDLQKKAYHNNACAVSDYVEYELMVYKSLNGTSSLGEQ